MTSEPEIVQLTDKCPKKLMIENKLSLNTNYSVKLQYRNKDESDIVYVIHPDFINDERPKVIAILQGEYKIIK